MAEERPRTRRIARINLDEQTLSEILQLPGNVRIVAQHIDAQRNSLVIFIESEELRECEQGQMAPEIYLSILGFHREDGETWYRPEFRIPDDLKWKEDE